MAWYWENLGGPPGGCTSGPTAVLQPGGLLALFVRGADNAIWRRREWRYENNLFWSSWGSLPGGFITTSNPDAAVNAHGLLVVFARGADNAIWHTWQPNAYNPDQWAQWQSLGGEFLSGPGAVLQTGGRLVVFARGTDGAIWHRWQVSRNGEWSGWESLGGYLVSDPDAALNADGGLVVFARGPDQAIWHTWQGAPDGEWAGWHSLEGTFESGPGAMLDPKGRLIVGARTSENQVWRRMQLTRNGEWGSWERMGTYNGHANDPDAAVSGGGAPMFFATGRYNYVWYPYWRS